MSMRDEVNEVSNRKISYRAELAKQRAELESERKYKRKTGFEGNAPIRIEDPAFLAEIKEAMPLIDFAFWGVPIRIGPDYYGEDAVHIVPSPPDGSKDKYNKANGRAFCICEDHVDTDSLCRLLLLRDGRLVVDNGRNVSIEGGRLTWGGGRFSGPKSYSPGGFRDLLVNSIAEERAKESERRRPGGCYVATCVYGSYDCPQVWTLRRFRDFELAETRRGRAFVRVYYAVSPTIVRLFGGCSWFGKMWRGPLDALVRRCEAKGFDGSPYEDRIW